MTSEEIFATTKFNRSEASVIARAAHGNGAVEPFVWAMIKSGVYGAEEIAERTGALKAMMR